MKKFVKKIARSGLLTLAKLESVFDKVYLNEDVPLSNAIEPHELMSYFPPQRKETACSGDRKQRGNRPVNLPKAV
jgi:hypothetical protein